MDLLKDFLDKDEVVIGSTKSQVKYFTINKLKSYWLYIIMWLIMNAFFLYLYFLQEISNNYWFVCIPIIGFDLLGLLAIFNSIAKPANDMADIGYAYSDKALYMYNTGRHKYVNKILYSDVVGFEKAKEGTKGFYVYSKTNVIKIEFIENEAFWYKEIAKRINTR